MARHVVDWAYLAKAFETILRYRRISLRKAAKEMGLPPTTLAAIRKGKALNADGLTALLMWLPHRNTPPWVKEV